MDVTAIYEAELALGKTPKEARQGTRTRVQELLHLEKPSPYSDKPSHVEAAQREVGRSITWKERADMLAHQHAQVTEAEMIESERARSGPDGGHRDAHHYVQKKHQMGLWVEADRLVNEALGVAS